MKLVLRVAKPANDQQSMLRLESLVDDIKDPGIAYVTLNGIEYVIEVHYADSVITH